MDGEKEGGMEMNWQETERWMIVRKRGWVNEIRSRWMRGSIFRESMTKVDYFRHANEGALNFAQAFRSSIT